MSLRYFIFTMEVIHVSDIYSSQNSEAMKGEEETIKFFMLMESGALSEWSNSRCVPHLF
jgi:hypothetical protein